MIIPDVNLLVYSYNTDAPHHREARLWWEDLLSGAVIVGLPWITLLGFLCVMTSRRILLEPLSWQDASTHVRSWLEQPPVVIVAPGSDHLDILDSLAREGQVTGDLTTDLHLAALAIENQAELHSNDSDFIRFSGLRWKNPLL